MATTQVPPQLRMLVGGEWVESSGGETFESVNPATGDVVALLPKAGRDDARSAIRAANAARASVAGLPIFERARLCSAIAESMEAKTKGIARELSQEQGKPLAEALAEVRAGAAFFRDAAETVTRLETSVLPSPDPAKRVLTIRQPHGVVAILTPWNYPIGIPSYYLGSALAGGNAIVWKPAPTTSAIAVRLARCMLEAGVGDGRQPHLRRGRGGRRDRLELGYARRCVYRQLRRRQRRRARAGAKPVLLELGGNGPVIVLDDAEVERAVGGAAFGSFSNAGQICQSSGRILVHERLHDELVEELAVRARSLRLGNPLDEETTIGPLNNEGVARKMDEHLTDAVGKGAHVVVGGRRAEGFPTRLFYEPTVLDGISRESLVNREETFGPVAPVMTVHDVDEAIAVANECSLGLLASVYTRSLSRAFYCAERLECGVVNVNETPAYWDGRTPFGGYSGKGSGVGRLGGKETILAMTQNKSIVLDLGTAVE